MPSIAHNIPHDHDHADVRPGSVEPVEPQPSAIVVRRVGLLRHEIRRFRLTVGLTSGDIGRLAEIELRLDQIEDLHRGLLGFAPRPVAPLHTGSKPGAPGGR